jgi:hypothetical protein
MVKFYVGEMSSYKVDLGSGLEEVHVLVQLDCVLVADTPAAVECLDDALRCASQDFIRSDTTTRTLVDFNVFEEV